MSFRARRTAFSLSFVAFGCGAGASPLALGADAPERVIVSSPGLADEAFTSSRPMTLLDANEIRLRAAPTLGDTLANEPGVSSSFYGPGTSRPVIRGLDGNRVRVLSDGVALFDVSNTGPDHGISLESTTAARIEILRGPAAIRYGATAIGGLISVTTGRIPESPLLRPIEGTFDTQFSSGSDGKVFTGVLQGGSGGFNYHFDAAYRNGHPYDIPGFKRSAALRAAEPLNPDETEIRGTLPNSQYETKEVGGGISYTWRGGFIGLGAGAYHTEYGVPNEEKHVVIKLNQRRFDLRGQLEHPLPGLESARFAFSSGSFKQSERGPDDVDGPGIVFKNRGFEGRLELRHQPVAGWTGMLGYQVQRSNFSVLGDQSFEPPTRTLNNGIFLSEERTFAPFRLEFGLRYENQRVDIDAPAPNRRNFHTFSASAGLVYLPNDDYSASVSVSYTQRPPSGLELFGDGPYVDIDRFVLGDSTLKSEKALAFDASLRKRTGWITGSANFFHYRFDNYVALLETGGTSDDEFELPLARYTAVPASFIGFEADAQIHLLGPVLRPRPSDEKTKTRALTGKEIAAPPAAAPARRDLYLDLRGDYTHAENRATSEALPRIPPLRLGAGLVYADGRITARVEYRRVFRQNRVSEFELPTPGYNDLVVSLDYQFSSGPLQWSAFVKATNLTNAEQRNHVSFIKDLAPLQARAAVVGLRASF